MQQSRLVPELTVSRFSESLRFYVDIVGFQVKYRRTEPHFAYLDLEGAQLMIEAFHSDGWNVGELHRPYGRGINFQIETSDAKSLRNRIVSNGYLLYIDLEDCWYDVGTALRGQRQFLVQDPDGYLLRFSEHLGDEKSEV